MKEKSIIFRGDGVLAILEDRKTKTRRVITEKWQLCRSPEDEPDWFIENCPYGKTGDRLWVRETWMKFNNQIIYRADRSIIMVEGYAADGTSHGTIQPWRPSIFMPRWASRITLEITGVRVERLWDISFRDCRAEGINFISDRPIHHEIANKIYRDRFQELWNSINAKRGYGWDVNPLVWVIEFRVIQKSKTN